MIKRLIYVGRGIAGSKGPTVDPLSLYQRLTRTPMGRMLSPMSPDAIVIIFLAVFVFLGIVKGIGDYQEHKAIKEIARNTRRQRRT
jgi:hypothetical protein